MQPLFMDDVARTMVEDRARAHLQAIAYQSGRQAARNRGRFRRAVGARLVAVGVRLSGNSELRPATPRIAR